MRKCFLLSDSSLLSPRFHTAVHPTVNLLSIFETRTLLSSAASSLALSHSRRFSSLKAKCSRRDRKPSSVILSNTALSLLRTKCKSMAHLKQIQANMIITGLSSSSDASDAINLMIDFCCGSSSKTGELGYCKMLLCNGFMNPPSYSWNVAIRAFGESESPEEAFLLYKQMLVRSSPSRPDRYTYPFLLKICSKLSLGSIGYQLLPHALKLGHDQDTYVHNALIYFFVCCEKLELAQKLFDESPVRDLVSWNSLINGYVRNGRAREALRLFEEMEKDGVEPDDITMIGVVSSCAKLEDAELGREFHQFILEKGLNLTARLVNALMDMYVKCGDLEEAKALFDAMEERSPVSWTTMIFGYSRFGFLDIARGLFDQMPEKGVVTWNAMIGGYVQANRGKEALTLFNKMQAMNVKPDEVTMTTILSACSQLGALDVGVWVHHYIEKEKLLLTVTLGTALVDMYAKCGNVRKAQQIFNAMPSRNLVTWTALIAGLAYHGSSQDALSCFSQMIRVGVKPDAVTFIAVLSACCHGGLVDEGRRLFLQMTAEFNMAPRIEHYSCMVDLLGRSGLLKEAEDLIRTMPMEADAGVWGALFSACRYHRNVAVGERAALKLLELDPGDTGIYVQLASMYMEGNMKEKALEVRQLMNKTGIEKTPGCSSIEVNGTVCEFIVREKSHPQIEHIHNSLFHLTRHMEFLQQRPDAD